MPRTFRIRPKNAGLPPGTLVHVGEKKVESAKVKVLDYDGSDYREFTIETIDQCLDFRDTSRVTWIDVVGLHQLEVVAEIGSYFGIHPLVLEDIVNTEQRPKMEDFEEYVFIVLKMLYRDKSLGEVKSEHISLIVGHGYLISFQEVEGDVFEPVRERIRKAKGRIRRMGADYLAYALIDSVVDNYFFVLEDLGESLEDLEEEVTSNPSPEISKAIHSIKREMIFLRKSVWPLREVVSLISKGESPLFQEATEIYFRDVYDHTIQVIDTIETFRDMLSGMLDVYLSTISNRMNEVMKVLTIIATIFIPMTLVAGIYGMNFDYMPELRWHWGYPAVMILMLAMGVVMMIYFRKKGWV